MTFGHILKLMSNLIIIFGPPAVGKMTIGQEIVKRFGFKLLMNHHTIDLLLEFFEWGSDEFVALNALFRNEIITKFSSSSSPGLIFTYLWDLKGRGDKREIDRYIQFFEEKGGDVYFVELESTLEERLKRNRTENRISKKPSKRNLELSEKRLLEAEKYKANSEDDFFYRHRNYVKINNTKLQPGEVVDRIIEKFNFKEIIDHRVTQIGSCNHLHGVDRFGTKE